MVVVNITNKELRIKEIRSIVPADGKQYIVPFEVAQLYKHALKPIQMSDAFSVEPMEESISPINQQIQEMNHNAVTNLEQLEKELNLRQEPTKTQTAWDSMTKLERITQIYNNNPEFTIKKISQFAGTSYVYAQKVVAKLKKDNNNAKN